MEASARGNVTSDDLALAEQLFEDGVEAFDEHDFVAASDFFAQCLETKVAKFGEHDIRVVPVYLKYSASLLECARQEESDVIGSLKTKDNPAQNGGDASTSSGITKPAVPEPSVETEDDLNLAWQMAEIARLVLYQAGETDETISHDDYAEVHEILADISSEREAFEDAINDFQQALGHLDKADEKDQRWQAELNFKLSLPLQFLDRVDEATVHVNKALVQMKSLLKTKQCRKEELSAAEANQAADTKAVEQPEPKVASADAEVTQQGVAATEEADEHVETDLEVIERELKQIAGVLEDLEERKIELQSAVEQDKIVRASIKNAMGIPDAPSDGATTNVSNVAPVQDLGVRGKATAPSAEEEPTENGTCNIAEPAAKRAKNE